MKQSKKREGIFMQPYGWYLQNQNHYPEGIYTHHGNAIAASA
jgi:hypothetical protein